MSIKQCARQLGVGLCVLALSVLTIFPVKVRAATNTPFQLDTTGFAEVVRLAEADGSFIYQPRWLVPIAAGQTPTQPPSSTEVCSASGDMQQICDLQGLRIIPAADKESLLRQFGAPQISLFGVLNSATRAMAHGQCGQGRLDLPLVQSYCMPGSDQTNRWMLQGITGEGESGWPAVEGLNLTIVSAYHNQRGPTYEHARISLINNTTGKLLHARLVEAKAGHQPGCAFQNDVSLCQLISHAGGLAWAGKYLYMAGASRLHVFDLTHFVQLDDEYVLPEIRRDGVTGPNNFKMAFVSVDTSRHELIAGPYLDNTTREPLAHWPLRADGSLASPQASYAVATQGRQQSIRIQGAASHEGTYFLSQSGSLQTKEKDYLYIIRPGGTAERRRWLYGAEDLYIDPTRQLLWGPGEVAGRRSVVGVDISRYLSSHTE
jgi:hypothetical protein